jgi:hypothetical protein
VEHLRDAFSLFMVSQFHLFMKCQTAFVLFMVYQFHPVKQFKDRDLAQLNTSFRLQD